MNHQYGISVQEALSVVAVYGIDDDIPADTTDGQRAAIECARKIVTANGNPGAIVDRWRAPRR